MPEEDIHIKDKGASLHFGSCISYSDDFFSVSSSYSTHGADGGTLIFITSSVIQLKDLSVVRKFLNLALFFLTFGSHRHV